MYDLCINISYKWKSKIGSKGINDRERNREAGGLGKYTLHVIYTHKTFGINKNIENILVN